MQSHVFKCNLRKWRRKTTFVAMFAALFVAGIVQGRTSAADERAPARILSGKPLRDALQLRRSLTVSGQALRKVTGELGRNTGIAICLDRRLDPSDVIEVATGYVTTEETLKTLAKATPNTAASIGERYVFIGPVAATARLRTLLKLRQQDVQSLRGEMKSETHRKLVESRKAAWPRLSEPRQLLSSAADDMGLKVLNPELVPHDLWAAANLPSLTFAELATLVLNQFDLTFELSTEGTVKYVHVPERVAIEQRYRVSPKKKPQVVDRWKTVFPDLEITWRGSTAIASATVEAHERLAALIRDDAGTDVGTAGLRNRLFTMKVSGASYADVIDKFRSGGIRIRIVGRQGPELAELLRQPVTFDLIKSSSDEFFKTIFVGLKADVLVSEDEVRLTLP